MIPKLSWVAALAAAPAGLHAQAPPAPVTYSGAIISTAPDSVELNTKNGRTTVPMIRGWTVVVPHPVPANAIKPGDFVASANRNIDVSSGRSTEVRILEPAYRPEFSSHPMGQPNTSMTHALVIGSRPGPDGQHLRVTFPGGNRELIVPLDVPVVGYDVKGQDFAVPGAVVDAVTRPGKDGVGRAARLIMLPGNKNSKP